jgi:large subunit ribosomal protein L13
MKSFLPKDPGADRTWFLVDAGGKPLGRLATGIADILRGKNKPTFSPQVDTGGFVVVVNAGTVKLTGRKETDKIYERYSGYNSGLKRERACDLRARHPDRMIAQAVRGMLPKNNLSRDMMCRLKVYAGGEHPHAAQKPVKVDVVKGYAT